MYRAHWGLNDSPFKARLEARYFFESPTHEEGLARLHFLVDQRRRLGLLTGAHGSGKSFLLEVFAGQMRDAGRVVAKISLLGVDPAEFLWQLAVALGSNPRAGQPAGLVWRTLADKIAEFRYQNQHLVVLLDDAHQASREVLAQVGRLTRLDMGRDAQLTLVTAARADKVRRLGDSLLELVELRMELASWELDDTQNYLEHSLAVAGRRAQVFSTEALQRLHELGRGTPGRIGPLAELALLAGAGQQLELIDAETIETVYHELADPRAVLSESRSEMAAEAIEV